MTFEDHWRGYWSNLARRCHRGAWSMIIHGMEGRLLCIGWTAVKRRRARNDNMRPRAC